MQLLVNLLICKSNLHLQVHYPIVLFCGLVVEMTATRRPLFLISAIMARGKAMETSPRICKSDAVQHWGAILCKDGLLRLNEMLPCGQSFRWVNNGHVKWEGNGGEVFNEWVGVISDSPVILRQSEPPRSDPDTTVYLRLTDLDEPQKRIRELRDYLRVDVDLGPLYESFCDADEDFCAAHERHPGARIMCQPPEETVFGFICSSNNNIRRIESMVRHLASTYGRHIGEYDSIPLYQFPTVESLAKKVNETDLRENGFGYRAKFIVGTANALVTRAKTEGLTVEQWLLSLRGRDREEVANELMKLPGVGRKVAGCIGLMCLEQFSEIPVDTHVWKIAHRYLPHLKKVKSLTPTVYRSVGDFFRERFSEEYAGLAHNTLFLEELKDFKPLHKKGGLTHKKRRAARWADVDENGRSSKVSPTVKKESGKLEVKNEPKISSVLLRLPRQKRRRVTEKKEKTDKENL